MMGKKTVREDAVTKPQDNKAGQNSNKAKTGPPERELPAGQSGFENA